MVYGGSPENFCAVMHRGFKSYLLRHMNTTGLGFNAQPFLFD